MSAEQKAPEGMTCCEIAQAVGQTDRNVRRWVEKLADKMTAIKDKLSASSSRYPARYSLGESCQIIEQGLGKAAADVYRTNAVNAKIQARPVAVLPSGAQLDALTRMVGKAILSPAQVQRLLGLEAPIGQGVAALTGHALPPPPRPVSKLFLEKKARLFATLLGGPVSDTALLLQIQHHDGVAYIRTDALAPHFGVPCKRIQEIAAHLKISFLATRQEVEKIVAVLEAEEAL